MRYLWTIAALALLAGCSAPSATDAMQSKERAMLAPLKSKYPTTVMGYDFKGRTLELSLDMQGLSELDDDVEDAMKHDAVAAWERTYRATHPNEHGKVTVHMIDFRGHTVFTLPGKV